LQEQVFERIQIVPAECPDVLLARFSARLLSLSSDPMTAIAVRD